MTDDEFLGLAYEMHETPEVTDQQILGMQAEARALDYLDAAQARMDDELLVEAINLQTELIEKVIGSAKVEKEVRHWYVTFGYDHRDPITNVGLRNRYCIIESTYEEARDTAMERFQTGWSKIYANANDLPVELRIANGRELPAWKWRGAGVQQHGLTYFDHRTEQPSIADKLEIDREKAGYYDPDE